jgi:hypothetical protein
MREAFRTRREDFFGRINSGVLLEIVFLYYGDIKIPPKKVRFATISNALVELSSAINVVNPRE